MNDESDPRRRRLMSATRELMSAALALEDAALRTAACAAVGASDSLAAAYVAYANNDVGADVLLSIFLPLVAHPSPERLFGIPGDPWRGRVLRAFVVKEAPSPSVAISVVQRVAASPPTTVHVVSKIAFEAMDASNCFQTAFSNDGFHAVTFSTVYGEATIHALEMAKLTFERERGGPGFAHADGPKAIGGAVEGQPSAGLVVARYEAVASHTRPPTGLLFLVEPLPGIASLVTALQVSFPWNVVAGLVAIPLLGFWIGHVHYYFGARWRRTWHRLDHAWVALALGINVGDLTWDDALKCLIGIHYPGANRDSVYAEFKQEWANTRFHVNWLRDCFPDSRADFSSIESIRRLNGFSHFDLIEAIVHRESTESDYAAFAKELLRRGLPRRGVGAPNAN